MLGLHITCKTLGSNGVGGVEDIRLTPFFQNLRFTYNDQNLRFIHNYPNIRLKRRRGRGGQKGVGGAEVSGRDIPHQYTTAYNCRARPAGQRISGTSKTSIHIGRDSTRHRHTSSPATQ